jgi:hypothetical protein
MQYNMRVLQNARMVELVDTRDLKSLASNGMPVQVRLRVPLRELFNMIFENTTIEIN